MSENPDVRVFNMAFAFLRGAITDQKTVEHSIDVFMCCAGLSRDQRVAAILHDVCEDSAHRPKDLWRFGKEVIEIVDAMTRREDESYKDYLRRLARCRLARPVKRRDLWCNLRRRPVPGDLERRYTVAMDFLYTYEDEPQ